MEALGWIRLHRRLLDWEWFTESATLQLFIYCLLKANHKSNKWRGIDVRRGEFITSLEKISIETGLSVQQVRTSLRRLLNASVITESVTNKFRVVTVCNYDSYQPLSPQKQQKEEQSAQQSINDQTTIEQQTNNNRTTTNNNEKNIKNDNNEKISLYGNTNPPDQEQRERFLEIFFFKNYQDPINEVDRFIDHYAASGWCRAKGTPVKDRIALARTWQQDARKQTARFDDQFLTVWKQMYISVCKVAGIRAISMLNGIIRAERMMDSLTITAKTVLQNDLRPYFDKIIKPIWVESNPKTALFWKIKP